MHELTLRTGQANHLVREFAHGELLRVTDVDGTGEIVRGIHGSDHRLDQIVDIAEAPGLLTVAVDRDVLAPERLHHEIADHAAVVRLHARPVGVEDPDHLDPELVLAPVVEEQRLCTALALIVAAANPDGIHSSPVFLLLRMNLRIAVNFAGARLQDLRLHALGETQHVDRAVHAGLRGLHRIELVVYRGSGAREVVDVIDLHVERKRDVVPQKLESRIAQQVPQVALVARVEIIHAEHVVAAPDESFAKMRAQKTCAAGHQDFSHSPLRFYKPAIIADRPCSRISRSPSPTPKIANCDELLTSGVPLILRNQA